MLVPSGSHAKYRISRNAESPCNPRSSRVFNPKIAHSIPRRPIFLRAMSATLGSDLAYAAPEASDVAFVQEASGRVVAFSQGKPILLEALDTIKDRTQVDLRANSELRICHYQLRQVLVLKGPVRASISRDSVTAENAKPILTYSGSCSAPIVSTYSGHLEKFLSPSPHESDSITVRGKGRMERACHGAEGLFRC